MGTGTSCPRSDFEMMNKSKLLMGLVMIGLAAPCYGDASFKGGFAFGGNMVLSATGTVAAVSGGEVQHFSLSSTRMDGGNVWSNTGVIRIGIPEYTQLGNLLGISPAASGNANAAIGVGDDQTNAWVQACYGQHSANRKHIWGWYAANIRSNTHILYLTNLSGFSLTNFEGAGFEAYNVAASSPLDGTNTFSATSATTASAGSFTPSQTGDFVYQYVVRDGTLYTNQLFTAGSQGNIGWTLLHADLNDGLSAQWGNYSSASALNPQMTMQTAGDYLSMTMAFKTASQGSARRAGMWIASIQHQSIDNNAALPVISQFPTVGNCFVEGWQAGHPDFRITNVTSFPTQTWVHVVGSLATNGAGTSHYWVATNATPGSTLIVTNWLASSAVGHGTIMFADVVGAAPCPIDFASFQTNFQSVAGNNAAPPGITPSAANGIVFFQTEQDFNTVNGFTLSTLFLDSVWWDGNNPDGPSNLDENNGWGHAHNADNTTTIAPVWTYQVPGESIAKFTASALALMPPGGVKLHDTWLQSTQAVNTSATSLAVTLGVNNTAAGLLAVPVRIGANGRTITVSDTRGNTYTAGLSPTSDGQGDDVAVYYATNITAGANTVTVGISGAAASIRYEVLEYAGLNIASPLDKVASATFSASSAPSITLGSATTSAREVILVVMDDGAGSSSAYTAPDHFTIRETISGRLVTQDSIVSATGAYTGTMSWTGGSSSGLIAILTFK